MDAIEWERGFIAGFKYCWEHTYEGWNGECNATPNEVDLDKMAQKAIVEVRGAIPNTRDLLESYSEEGWKKGVPLFSWTYCVPLVRKGLLKSVNSAYGPTCVLTAHGREVLSALRMGSTVSANMPRGTRGAICGALYFPKRLADDVLAAITTLDEPLIDLIGPREEKETP